MHLYLFCQNYNLPFLEQSIFYTENFYFFEKSDLLSFVNCKSNFWITFSSVSILNFFLLNAMKIRAWTQDFPHCLGGKKIDDSKWEKSICTLCDPTKFFLPFSFLILLGTIYLLLFDIANTEWTKFVKRAF